jgi:hypothetical protein
MSRRREDGRTVVGDSVTAVAAQSGGSFGDNDATDGSDRD